MNLGVVEKNGKFVVTQNGQPINLPKSDGQAIVTEFTSKADAEKVYEYSFYASKAEEIQE